MLVRRREMVFEVGRLTRSLQAGEDYRFRHGSNLGGRAPRKGAPSTGMYGSSTPARAWRNISPPRLISPRPTKSAGNKRRSPKISSSGLVYFALATLPSNT